MPARAMPVIDRENDISWLLPEFHQVCVSLLARASAQRGLYKLEESEIRELATSTESGPTLPRLPSSQSKRVSSQF